MPSTMNSRTARALLLAGLLAAGLAQAQQNADGSPVMARDLATATATSNMPSGSGEASTMTRGVPNLLTSNPQPGELGIQTRLTVRPAATTARSSSPLNVMGAAPAASPNAFDPTTSALLHRNRD